MRSATVTGVSTERSERSRTPRMMVFEGSCRRIERSSFGWAASIEIWSAAERSSSERKD